MPHPAFVVRARMALVKLCRPSEARICATSRWASEVPIFKHGRCRFGLRHCASVSTESTVRSAIGSEQIHTLMDVVALQGPTAGKSSQARDRREGGIAVVGDMRSASWYQFTRWLGLAGVQAVSTSFFLRIPSNTDRWSGIHSSRVEISP